jgi:hypothetical protein
VTLQVLAAPRQAGYEKDRLADEGKEKASLGPTAREGSGAGELLLMHFEWVSGYWERRTGGWPRPFQAAENRMIQVSWGVLLQHGGALDAERNSGVLGLT